MHIPKAAPKTFRVTLSSNIFNNILFRLEKVN